MSLLAIWSVGSVTMPGVLTSKSDREPELVTDEHSTLLDSSSGQRRFEMRELAACLHSMHMVRKVEKGNIGCITCTNNGTGRPQRSGCVHASSY